MAPLHEQDAKELYARHAERLQAPEQMTARLRAGIAAGVCGLVFLGMYAFLAWSTYDFMPAKQQLTQVIEQAKDMGGTVLPAFTTADETWGGIQEQLTKEVRAQVEKEVEANVVAEMKKQIETN